MEYIEHLLPKLSKQVLAEKVECQVSGIQKAKKIPKLLLSLLLLSSDCNTKVKDTNMSV